MAKVPRKRSINAYRSALLYAKASLEFTLETEPLAEPLLPMIPKVNSLLEIEKKWTDSVIGVKGRLVAARQEWKLQFNQLLKEFNAFEYAEIMEMQEAVLEVYPRGNRGADYVQQVKNAHPVFQKVLKMDKLPANVKAKLKYVIKAGEAVNKASENLEILLARKEEMLRGQEELKLEINRTLDLIDKKLHKMFPYEQRYLGSFFYK